MMLKKKIVSDNFIHDLFSH